MYLVRNNIMPSKEWQHKPELQDIDGMTVAMYIAS